MGVGQLPAPAVGVEKPSHTPGGGLEPLVIDGKIEPFQDASGRFQVHDTSKPPLPDRR
uniref:Uncharacterized protein n=1 Tax=Candidatus Kentrum sp. DK TaxID=2126562 RepID=A0A450RV62_9GAMM|nr:MAG: hypothetical protein BECKDK2373B_GA0170837_100346 [Candidatus Kentron sp. DK]